MISPLQNHTLTLCTGIYHVYLCSYFDAEYSFQLYSGGIYTGGDCTSNINHASECSDMEATQPERERR